MLDGIVRNSHRAMAIVAKSGSKVAPLITGKARSALGAPGLAKERSRKPGRVAYGFIRDRAGGCQNSRTDLPHWIRSTGTPGQKVSDKFHGDNPPFNACAGIER